MNSNKKALMVLFVLVLISLAIFCAEKRFLIPGKRGTVLLPYEKIPWSKKILLLVDDFENMPVNAQLEKEKFFSFGGAQIGLVTEKQDKDPLAGSAALKVVWNKKETYGGWGKGVGENIDLDAQKDFVNFRVLIPKKNGESELLKVILEEDDNEDGKLQKDKDDQWATTITIPAADHWQLISVPLRELKDDNAGGDGVLNVTRKGGLHTVIFSFQQANKYTTGTAWYFDFIFFSSGSIDAKPIATLYKDPS